MSSGKSDELQARNYFQGEIGKSPLVNKLGLTNQSELDKIEAYCVEQTLKNGLSDKAKELSPNGLKQMHKEFFGEIYSWAGIYRDYTTGRGFPFCIPERIEKELDKIYHKLQEKLTDNINKQDFVKTSAWFIGELNTIHPFIDGNGRTQRATLDLIAEKSGFDINLDLLNKSDWYKSAEECHIYAKYDGFENIISSLIITEKTTQELIHELSPKLLKENFPELSQKDIDSIQHYKDQVMIRTSDKEEQNIALKRLTEILPNIEKGEISLPNVPKYKDIDLN